MNCDSNTFLAGETDQYFVAEAEGNYSVIVNLNGCETNSDCLLLSFAALDEQEASTMNVFPNPFRDEVMVEFKETKNGNVRLVSLQGEILYDQPFEASILQLPKQELAKGLYLLELSFDQLIITKNIVKE